MGQLVTLGVDKYELLRRMTAENPSIVPSNQKNATLLSFERGGVCGSFTRSGESKLTIRSYPAARQLGHFQ
jgi:hypothetical protein